MIKEYITGEAELAEYKIHFIMKWICMQNIPPITPLPCMPGSPCSLFKPKDW